MARNHLAACLVATLALGACGGAKQHAADDVAAKKVAAQRAHNDSVRKARATMAVPDSVAQVRTTLAAATAHVDTARPAVTAGATQAAGTRVDSMHVAAAEAARTDSLDKVHETEVQRETFAYAGGTRDPFASLITVTSAGPEISDLQLVGVYMDLRNDANTVAILREKVSSKRHKVRVGDRIGRLRVKDIRPRDVVFQVEDFGFERQETLSLRKQEDVTP